MIAENYLTLSPQPTQHKGTHQAKRYMDENQPDKTRKSTDMQNTRIETGTQLVVLLTPQTTT